MKKRLLFVMVVAMLAISLFAGCTQQGGEGPAETEAPPEIKTSYKVGMVTDAGTIDDKSFNQGTWEGVVKACDWLKLEKNYLKPVGKTEADYLKEIDNLNDAGFKLIVTPGFKFETAIFKAQDKHTDAKFVLIDGQPHNADYSEFKTGENTVSIFYAEHESGFLAGVATAMQLKEGELGFIGGMEIPPVQKFNWGFQQGVKYANENLGTNCNMAEENVIYQGSFDNVAAGQQLGAAMYDKGVKAIFCAAGGVGVGAINEAKARAQGGEEVWIIGVDVDQYADGIYEGEKSVMLTSAMKRIDQSAFDMIVAATQDEFPGGQILTFDAKNNGVGIPAENPNLDKEVTDKVAEIFTSLVDGSFTVSAEQGDLIK